MDSGPRVLYIEDDPGFARLVQKTLEREGYRLDVAREGAEGLAKAGCGDYDIVLLDYALPDIDGIQLLETLCKDAGVPVIVTTGVGSEDLAVKAMKLGAHDYLVKDVRGGFIDVLPSRIDRALQYSQLTLRRQDAENERKRSEEKLRSLLSSLDDFVFVVDSDQVITDMRKPVSLADQPLPLDEWVGKPLGVCRPRELAEALADAIETVKWTGLVVQFDFSLDINGEQRWFNAKVSAYRMGTDSSGVTVLARDMTRRLALERALQVAKREAEQANKAKTEFLANISHELRTPLTAIIGFSEIIEKGLAGELTDKQKRYAAAIKESGKHLVALINDILDLSKVEVGAMRLDLSVVDVSSLIANSVVMLRAKAEEQGVSIRTEVTEEVSAIRVKADERKLNQILYNLLSNAVKFTPSGGQVSVGAQMEMSNLVLYVEDTGIGIAREDQARIFDEFYQVKQSIKGQRSGTGLGLALTRKLVELHGGTIKVSSQVGSGSRFTCELPALERSDRAVLRGRTNS